MGGTAAGGKKHERIKRKRLRHNRFMRIILSGIGMAALVPVTAGIILGVQALTAVEEIGETELILKAQSNEVREVSGVFTTAYIEESPRETEAGILSSGEEIQKSNDYQKMVYLTFDDGPSIHTDRILDILKEYDVKATFFVVGKTDERSLAAYRRIVEEGHTLGMHSYSHKYGEIYQSKETFTEDLVRLQEYLYEVTGVWSRYYRFPGGSSNTVSRTDVQELIRWLNDNGITYYDWNITSGDAVSGQLSKQAIINNCMSGIEREDECLILMHDAAEKSSTVDALPEIISRLRMRGDVSFLNITDETIPIQHLSMEQTIQNE